MAGLAAPIRALALARGGGLRRCRTAAAMAAAPAHRQRAQQLHSSAPARMAYKDDQDRTSLKPKSHEYTLSGTDDDVAAQHDAAFDPNITSPEAAVEIAGKGKGEGNPLEMSPANKEAAQGGRAQVGGQAQAGGQAEEGKQRRSGAGSPAKGGKAE